MSVRVSIQDGIFDNQFGSKVPVRVAGTRCLDGERYL